MQTAAKYHSVRAKCFVSLNVATQMFQYESDFPHFDSNVQVEDDSSSAAGTGGACEHRDYSEL